MEIDEIFLLLMFRHKRPTYFPCPSGEQLAFILCQTQKKLQVSSICEFIRNDGGLIKLFG